MRDLYFFDTETIGFNPYKSDSKLLTVQVKKNNDNPIVYKLWNYSNEKELIDEICYLLHNINFNSIDIRTYNPLFAYNGMFDIHYMMGRVNMLFNDDIKYICDFFEIIRVTNYCDMMMYNNGYFVKLETLCFNNNIERKSEYNGSDIKILYENKMYDDIVAHGIDDVEALYQLYKLGYADRFINTLTERCY